VELDVNRIAHYDGRYPGVGRGYSDPLIIAVNMSYQ